MTNRVDPAARAAACARLAAVAEAEGLEPAADPSFAGQLRHLYEHSALPVREIAKIAGIIERTLYSYASKGGWQRRNWRHAAYRGARVVPAGTGFPETPGVAPTADDARQTATDYLQARRLAETAGAAAALAAREREARREAERIKREARDHAEAEDRTWKQLDRALDQLIEAQSGAAADDPGTRAIERRVNMLFDRLDNLQRHSEVNRARLRKP
jgi:hypothetical protein